MAAEYNSTIRAITLGFGNLFNSIQVLRYNEDGSEHNRFLVPIEYANKEKYVARLQGDPNLDRNVQITLPAMSFEMVNLEYDSSRKQMSNVKTYYKDKSGSVQGQYNPVPYNFDFNLYIYVRNQEDGLQIIERILPFFAPDYTIKVNLVPTLGVVKEIPIVLNSTNYENDYEGDFNSDTRVMIWTLNFTVKGYMYIATNEAKIIKTAITNILTTISDNDVVVFNLSQPGIGQYQAGEIVYQGYSLNTATATGTVLSFANGNLHLNNLSGSFMTGSPIVGMTTNATYNFSSYSNLGVVPSQLINIKTTANPNTATVNSLYTYTTTIQELNGM